MRHTTDGNAIAADAHYDQAVEIGNEDGETCGRVDPPDEDAPRGYKPKPCQGVMEPHFFNAAAAMNNFPDWIECDTCGEIGE